MAAPLSIHLFIVYYLLCCSEVIELDMNNDVAVGWLAYFVIRHHNVMASFYKNQQTLVMVVVFTLVEYHHQRPQLVHCHCHQHYQSHIQSRPNPFISKSTSSQTCVVQQLANIEQQAKPIP
jgi:hypothetical protein